MSMPLVSSTTSLAPWNGTITPAGVEVSSTPAHLVISKNRAWATGHLAQRSLAYTGEVTAWRRHKLLFVSLHFCGGATSARRQKQERTLVLSTTRGRESRPTSASFSLEPFVRLETSRNRL